jgi:hypothetical protein
MMRLTILVWAVLAATLATTASSAQQTEAIQSSPLHENYDKRPLTFEANQGQTAPEVRFLSRANGYTVFLTAGGIVLSLRPNQAVPLQQTGNIGAPINSQLNGNTAVQFNLVGAAQSPTVIGEDPQPGRVNYFIGRDPAKWHTNVPTYASVRYKNVYPGIDLIYYGNHRQLEYDFAVSPGADPSYIQFRITGANRIELDAEGNLVLQTGSGELHFQNPAIYQESNGSRAPVSGRYVVKDSTHIAFLVAAYDSSKPLVIDPVLVYSTYLGANGNDQPSGIAVDSTGSVYAAGYTDSTDFPLAAFGSLPAGSTHAFVAKLDATGSNLVYADYIGGSGEDCGYALVLDGANDVYVTGSTSSSDFPVVNPYQGIYPGNFNAFLTEISADGSSLLYSTYLGGNGRDLVSSIARDGSGDVFVAGNTTSTNFPTVNAYQSTASPSQGGHTGNYGFLTKFSPDGSYLVYSTYLSGNSNAVENCGGAPCWPAPRSAINGIALDTSGNAYAAGITNTYNFPTTEAAYLTTNTTPLNATVGFVSKLTGLGTLDYSTYFYESSGTLTNINAIAVDSLGSAYVTGVASSDGTFPITSTTICDPGTYGLGCGYAFVTKLDPAGATLLYSTFLGPDNYATPEAIVLDANNDAYVVASTSSNLFGIVNGIEPYTGGSDLLLVEIDPSATTQIFATYLGGSADDFPAGIALDSSGNLYIAGFTDSTDFPVTQGAFQTTIGRTPDVSTSIRGPKSAESGGASTNAFLLKIGPDAAPTASVSPTSLQYNMQAVGSTSPVQTVLLRNMGSSALSLLSTTTSKDFAQTNDCGSSLAAASSCAFAVSFMPTAAGTRSGSIQIRDDAAGSPHLILLNGDGGTGADFSVATSTGSDTITAGATATYALTVSSVGGSFTNAVQLTCNGAPKLATCSVSPSSTTPAGTPVTATVTVTTTGSSALATPLEQSPGHPIYALTFQGLGLFGIMLAGSRSRASKLRVRALLALIMLASMFTIACAGVSTSTQQHSGTTPGTYTIIVTGTSGALQHSLPLILTVQ